MTKIKTKYEKLFREEEIAEEALEELRIHSNKDKENTMTKIKREIPAEVREELNDRFWRLYEETFEDHCDRYDPAPDDPKEEYQGWYDYLDDFHLFMKERGWTFKTPEKKEETS